MKTFVKGDCLIKGDKHIYLVRKGGGTCFFMEKPAEGKYKIRGPFLKQVAQAKVAEINATTAQTGISAVYLGPRPKRRSLASLL